MKGVNLMDTTAVKSAVTTAQERREPVKLLRRIGSVTVEVTVYFSNTSNETLEDKLLRMIEREANDVA
jgi:hypothetical protein